MARKADVLVDAVQGHGCLGKAHMDEELFVLRAQDVLAPALVEAWADMAEALGCGKAKANEARRCAARMRSWRTRKSPD